MIQKMWMNFAQCEYLIHTLLRRLGGCEIAQFWVATLATIKMEQPSATSPKFYAPQTKILESQANISNIKALFNSQ